MSDRKDDLTSGLVGERRELYLQNPHFYHAVNQLVSMLPLWMDAIAADAMRSALQEERQMQIISEPWKSTTND